MQLHARKRKSVRLSSNPCPHNLATYKHLKIYGYHWYNKARAFSLLSNQKTNTADGKAPLDTSIPLWARRPGEYYRYHPR